MSAVEQDIRNMMLALMPRLRRFAYGLTGSLEEADELVQATLARALERLHQWRPDTRLDSWLYRIAQTIRLNQRQADTVRGKHLEAVDPDTLVGHDGVTVMEARLTLDAVRRFIWKLPEEQRTVLLLVVVEGLSYKEVADLLDVPVGTVTSRLARARIAVNDFVNQSSSEPSRLQHVGGKL